MERAIIDYSDHTIHYVEYLSLSSPHHWSLHWSVVSSPSHFHQELIMVWWGWKSKLLLPLVILQLVSFLNMCQIDHLLLFPVSCS